MGFLLNPYRLFIPSSGNIEFVGMESQSGSVFSKTVSLTSLTGGIATAAIEGDFVLGIAMVASSADRNPSISTAGFTQIADIYANDQNDTMLNIAWKIMTSTPDTSVSYAVGGVDSGGSHVCVNYVFRGVNQTTPLDVSAVNNSGTNGANSNPSSITPITAGSKLVIINVTSHDRGAIDFTGTGYLSNLFTANRDGSNKDISVAIGTVDWTSGAYDPAELSHAGSTTNDSTANSVIALRPA